MTRSPYDPDYDGCVQQGDLLYNDCGTYGIVYSITKSEECWGGGCCKIWWIWWMGKASYDQDVSLGQIWFWLDLKQMKRSTKSI